VAIRECYMFCWRVVGGGVIVEFVMYCCLSFDESVWSCIHSDKDG
jgi:hypothetical protein